MTAASAGLSNSSSHRYHVRVKVLKGEGSNSTSCIVQGRIKISNYIFVLVRKVRSEKTGQGGGREKNLSLKTNEFK